jgi:dimethylglycine dehydrogenase
VLGKSLALAYVKPQHGKVGIEMDIEILGERKKATVLGESPFDPENRRLRA